MLALTGDSLGDRYHWDAATASCRLGYSNSCIGMATGGGITVDAADAVDAAAAAAAPDAAQLPQLLLLLLLLLLAAAESIYVLLITY